MSDNYTAFIAIDGMAKIIYSMFLTDLGQSIGSNVLASPEKVFEFGNKTPSLISFQAAGSDGCTWRLDIAPHGEGYVPTDATAFYKWANTSLPSVNPSVIPTQYLCQVPKLISAATLIVGILVADLVLL